MRAAVTGGAGSMTVVERPEPGPPGPGEVVIRPEAVGLCGSDYHFFTGEMSDAAGGSQFPRVQGHELAGEITAIGPGCRPELEKGLRVAVWPLHPCGLCYPCGAGRPNACDRLTLTGVHLDGGLQDLLAIGQRQVFPIAVADPRVAALAEPVSIAVRAVNRAGVRPGERAVVLGAGPIGQCIGLVARERGASTLLIDLQESRLALSREMGAQDAYLWRRADDVVAFAREWAGPAGQSDPAGPPVAFDATGAATATTAMIEMVASAGRAVQVGMSNEMAQVRVGILTEKELDLLGVSCCDHREFAEAVAVVERNASRLARLVSHEFALDRAPEAIRFAIANPAEVMKVVISG
ncbi:MAG TPA: alcohol dehydrogenase catalytic domain-containing protein [Streptosporangiaceae bacterium]|nr:alcohol dehydrogenase catalytic domain-containing protein [Streptosporangiaceae bacterium]